MHVTLGAAMAIKEELTPYRNLSVGTTGAIVQSSEGQLFGGLLSNNHATDARFVKLYNKATAPTHADTPVMTVRVPALSTVNFSVPNGVRFSAGISVRASTALADADTGAPSANDVVANLFYR